MYSIIVLLVIILVVSAIIWFLRSQGTRTRRKLRHTHEAREPQDQKASLGGLDKLQSSGMFWGVEIGQPGCEAAHKLLGQQYSFAEAPELPLEGCTSAMCTCLFKGVRECRSRHRRKQDDRRGEVRYDKGKSDRRSPKNRRRSDSWNDHNY